MVFKQFTLYKNIVLISSFLEIDFAINISDKKSRRFDLELGVRVCFVCALLFQLTIDISICAK